MSSPLAFPGFNLKLRFTDSSPLVFPKFRAQNAQEYMILARLNCCLKHDVLQSLTAIQALRGRGQFIHLSTPRLPSFCSLPVFPWILLGSDKASASRSLVAKVFCSCSATHIATILHNSEDLGAICRRSSLEQRLHASRDCPVVG